jgi:hypothetical protein
MIEHIPSVQS